MIVLLSQISLFVTFLLYFLQCGHTLHLCREMMNTMFFFTALLHKDDGFEDGAVTRDGRIFFIPSVALHKPHNAVSWYVLRRYIKDVYRNTRKQTEIIVVRKNNVASKVGPCRGQGLGRPLGTTYQPVAVT
jgi:hypothetical protein